METSLPSKASRTTPAGLFASANTKGREGLVNFFTNSRLPGGKPRGTAPVRCSGTAVSEGHVRTHTLVTSVTNLAA